MKLMTFAVAALIAVPAHAAPFEMKGIKSGDTAEMHIDRFESVAPGFPACHAGIPANAVGLSDRKFANCRLADGIISGVKVGPSFAFNPGGTLVSVWGMFDGDHMSVMTTAFTMKYGKPTTFKDESYVSIVGNIVKVSA